MSRSAESINQAAEPPQVSRPRTVTDLPSTVCLHCATTLVGDYCHNCGQKLVRKRLTVKAVMIETFAQLTKWDSSLLRTITTLFAYPAEVAFAYLVGQRQHYVAPVRYIIVALAVEFASTPFFRWTADQIGNTGAQVWLEQSGISYILRFLQVFVLASIWRFLFRREGYNIAEVYAFGMYVFGQIIIINVMINALAVTLPIPNISREVSIAALSLVDFAYLVHAARGFFAKTWPTTSARILLSYIAPAALLWGWLQFAR